jgi:hypothetical protein
MKTIINAAAALTEIRGMYMGGAHHEVGGLSRKRYTQCVVRWTTKPKGHWGNLGLREHRRGPTRTKARKGVRRHERSGWKLENMCIYIYTTGDWRHWRG